MESVAKRPVEAAPAARDPVRRLKKRRRRDRAARWVVSGAGIAIIAVILGILGFIVYEVWPLLGSAHVEMGAPRPLAVTDVEAVAPNEHLELGAALSKDGLLRLVDLRTGAVKKTWDALTGGTLAEGADVPTAGRPLSGIRKVASAQQFAAATSDGHVLAVSLAWREWFEGSDRRVDLKPPVCIRILVDPARKRLRELAAVVDPEDGGALVAGVTEDGSLHVVKRTVEVDDFTEETTESFSQHQLELPARPDILIVDKYQRNLYAGAKDRLLWWHLKANGSADPPDVLPVPGAEVTALSLLKADVSLLVGHQDGEVSVWFQVEPKEGAQRELWRIRGHEVFGRQDAAIQLLAPSPRNKGFLAIDRGGGIGLYYSTSERTLWRGQSPVSDPRALAVAPKDNGAFVLGGDGLAFLDIENEHPEAGWKAYFGNIHYENNPAPDLTWQSSSGDDDYEPKLSLIPLIVGTLKGTFYSLLFAIPLAVLAALYASQFLHHTLREKIKPAIEIMAAMPSVVLGFVAGLWLARRMNAVVPGVMAMVVVLPLFTILGGWTWNRVIPARRRKKMRPGVEIAWQGLFIVLGGWVCVLISDPIQNALFDGDFAIWLTQSAGLRYDQQNSLVVSVAMGFAVIPIIFTISEEAFSSVPRSLPLGSLALGATQWQTVIRVVVPSASPGVFSAIMVGFGRAVGETMIILMAVGNTPIMNWNPFEGFRTLSANIATEIPEAPQGETLYRTLFLAVLMLFVLTFLVNTVAEVVRGRLRTRYASL